MAVIGRKAPADIVIAEHLISSRHAEIVFVEGDSYRVRDLGSTNGTFVNGEEITTAIVGPADRITLGPVLFDLNRYVDRIRGVAPHREEGLDRREQTRSRAHASMSPSSPAGADVNDRSFREPQSSSASESFSQAAGVKEASRKPAPDSAPDVPEPSSGVFGDAEQLRQSETGHSLGAEQRAISSEPSEPPEHSNSADAIISQQDAVRDPQAPLAAVAPERFADYKVVCVNAGCCSGTVSPLAVENLANELEGRGYVLSLTFTDSQNRCGPCCPIRSTFMVFRRRLQ